MRIQSACIAVTFASVGLFTATPLADDDACGNQTNVNNVITNFASWDILTSCTVTLTAGHTHRCVVTACADAALPVGSANNDYRFVVSDRSRRPRRWTLLGSETSNSTTIRVLTTRGFPSALCGTLS